MTAFGRSLLVVVTQHDDKFDKNDWSVRMQMAGKVCVITQEGESGFQRGFDIGRVDLAERDVRLGVARHFNPV